MASSSGGSGRQRGEEGGVLEGSWLWVALPVGILALIAALWFLIIAPAGGAPARATATPAQTATLRPTLTVMVVTLPTRTPEPTVAPTPTRLTTIAAGARVEVTGTGTAKLRVRQAPGTDTVTLNLVPDGTRFVVVGGPEQAGGITWWKVDNQAGLVGWVAAQYLKLVP